MAAPAIALVVICVGVGLMFGRAEHAFKFAAAELTDRAGYQARVLDNAQLPVRTPEGGGPLGAAIARGVGAVALAVAFAAISVSPLRRKRVEHGRTTLGIRYVMGPLRNLHSGHVGDYITFATFGVAAFGAVLIALLHFF